MPDEPYNLIHERWIPVRDEEGNVWDIAPWEVTQPGGSEDKLPTDPAAPRPDFDGALIQFLIGLMQTAFAPKTEREWRLKFKKPPKGDELKKGFERYAHAFNLDGDGPRFMQDYDFAHGRITDRTKERKISKLLIDAASDATRYFNKLLSESELDHASAAMALFAFQINDPGIGSGHRKSLRGGGPLTTLILGRTLWQTIWLNVLGEKDLQIRGASQERANKGDIFPWMAPTRTSGQDQNTTSTDVHPLQMYWSMPSRILLDSAEPSTASQNHLIKTESNTIFCSIKKKNHGTNYVGPWAHPLTPHRENGPVLGSAEVLSYRHWLGATITENKRQIRPAKVIRMAYRRASYSVVENTLGRRPQVWLFGYAMSNAKAEMWQDSTMPLFTVAPEVRVEFENFAHQLVNAADHLAGELKTALKRGLYGKKKNGGWDFAAHIKSSAEQKSVLDDTATRFWRDTEPLFFDYLSEAQSVLERNKDHDSDDDLTLDLRRKWLEGLREDHLLLLYDEVTASSTFHGADPKSVALARNELFWAAHESNDDIREKLNLPKE